MKIFGQLKKLVPIPGRASPKLPNLADIQNQLGDQFFGLLNTIYTERTNNPDNSKLNKSEVQKVINYYANQNLLISSAVAMAPGPLGILASSGEMVAIVGNQMRMVYDLGCGFDKEEFFNKDVLIDIPLQAMGHSTNLQSLQNEANLLDSPDKVLKEKAMGFAKSLVEENAKKSIVRFVPIAGSVILGIWTKMSTNKMAKTAINFYDDDKVLIDTSSEATQRPDQQALMLEKIKTLINLMESNGAIADEELQFILPLIEHAEIDENQKGELKEQARSLHSNYEIDFGLFQPHEEEVNSLIFDLAVMAKKDGTVHPAQLEYLHFVAKQIGFDLALLDGML